MVNASKILTVSYGTFSCTLEGFDDPFSTMRSIAEYFRDLAADDRYFGAEPPTPDAEMLHRIAEREVNRRVEAKVERNGVVLRQTNDEQTDEAEPSDTASQALSLMAVSHADAAGAGPAAKPAADPVNEINDVDGKKMDAAAIESVADKLRRIRAAVARSHVEPQFTGTFAEDEHAGELFKAGSIDAAFADEAPAGTVTEDAAPTFEIEDQAKAEVTAFDDTAEEPQDFAKLEDDGLDAAADRADAEVQVSSDAFEDEVLIADDVALDIAPAAPEEIAVVVADEPAAFAGAFDDEIDAETASSEPQDVSVADEADELWSDADSEISLEDMSGFDVPQQVSSDAEVAEFEEEAGGEVDIDGLTAMFAGEDASPVDSPAETTESFDDAAESDTVEDDITALDATATSTEPSVAQADPAPEDDAVATPPVARARVVKMTRKEFMAKYVEVSSQAQEQDAEAADDGVAAAEAPVAESTEINAENIRASLGETGLSQEDEDDLINELVQVEREGSGLTDTANAHAEPLVLGTADAAPIFDNVDETRADGDAQHVIDGTFDGGDFDRVEGAKPVQSAEEIAETLAAAVAPGKQKSGELSVDRLLRQADSELKDDDSSRRRSAIAHLKAAVAAVRADGGRARQDADAEDAKAMNQFRDDLAKAVRPEPDDAVAAAKPKVVVPQRDVSQSAKAATSEAPRPRRKMPPLMLVSEQRIDKPVARNPDDAPVRPRRVQTDDLADDAANELMAEVETETASDAAGNMFGKSEDFQRFVADTSAEGVQELLEASLAFGTQVNGQPFNSRPEIMQRVLDFVPEGSVSREEGLRAFGVLLREGRITRLQRGQFVLPENSRFRQERKAAAG